METVQHYLCNIVEVVADEIKFIWNCIYLIDC